MKKFLKIVVFLLSLVLFMSPALLLFSCCSTQTKTVREVLKDSTTTLEIKNEEHVVDPPALIGEVEPDVETDSLVGVQHKTPEGGSVNITYKPSKDKSAKGKIAFKFDPPVIKFTEPDTNKTTNVKESEKETNTVVCSRDHTTFWGDVKKISIGAGVGILLVSAIWLYVKFKVSILQRIKHLW